MNWTKKLLLWYSENKRSFIWRTTKDPYSIWLSEIILQQTRTLQGLPYYEKFMVAFPSLSDLASAEEDKVLKLWQGLGYYSRARNLHSTAKYIHFDCKGIFPSTFKGLMKLKGVGDYTASAISSICYNIPEAVVDGNVYRFLSRFFGIESPINSSIGHKQFKAKAMELIDPTQPGEFNQALMEFGAIQCTPRLPNCSTCPFIKDCVAFNQNKIHLFPVKTNKIKRINKYFNFLVISDPKGRYVMERRTEKGIWQQLYQFPLVECENKITTPSELIQNFTLSDNYRKEIDKAKLWNNKPIIHKLSHQTLFINFWILEYENLLPEGYTKKSLQNLAVPVVIQKFIDKFFTIAI